MIELAAIMHLVRIVDGTADSCAAQTLEQLVRFYDDQSRRPTPPTGSETPEERRRRLDRERKARTRSGQKADMSADRPGQRADVSADTRGQKADMSADKSGNVRGLSADARASSDQDLQEPSGTPPLPSLRVVGGGADRRADMSADKSGHDADTSAADRKLVSAARRALCDAIEASGGIVDFAFSDDAPWWAVARLAQRIAARDRLDVRAVLRAWAVEYVRTHTRRKPVWWAEWCTTEASKGTRPLGDVAATADPLLAEQRRVRAELEAAQVAGDATAVERLNARLREIGDQRRKATSRSRITEAAE